MRVTSKLLSISLVLAVMILSCEDEKTNKEFENGKATIEGTALVNLDLSNDTVGIVYESVPQGIRIYATINSIDLVQFPSGGVNYGTIIYDTVVGANGSFVFEVDANVDPVTVTFSADDFAANQVQGDETTEETVFELAGFYTEVVRDGVTRITELVFTEK
jgi:hypothetical protein